MKVKTVGRKQRLRADFFQKHPFCCFCGDTKPAETIDHVPSRQMFTLKRRPKGLEVPACHECNQFTKRHEQVAALLARLYPDPKTRGAQNEVQKIMKACFRNVPGLMEELSPSWRQQYDFQEARIQLPGVGGPLNASGPMLNRSIKIFAVKLCLALHYDRFGQVVPVSGGVSVRWYSNFDHITNKIPDDFLNIFGQRATLQQGSWNVSEQFEYSWATPDPARMVAYFAVFRYSFAVAGFVVLDKTFLGDTSMPLYSPGSWGAIA